MNFIISIKPQKFFMAFFITLFFLTGCKLAEKYWIEKMISEIESAWVKADNAGKGMEASDIAASDTAKIYFKPGMPTEEAFKLLQDLKDNGFEIREYRNEGSRSWPENEFLPWDSASRPDPASTKNFKLQYPKGTSHFTMKKAYGWERLIIRKTILISLSIDDKTKVVGDVKARIWADSI